MKITIGHIFYDLLNLYGESGNVIALEKALKTQDIEVEIKKLSLDNEPWDLNNVDILYVGAGTEANQMLALNTFMKYKEVINQMLINNKIILSTGNSIELFGKTIKLKDQIIDGLGIFDYTTEKTNQRMVAECVFNYEDFDDKILGFENHQSIIEGISNPLFAVEKGFGANLKSKHEGFIENNFYGTYLLGPLLVRNPKLLEKICKTLILSKDENFEFKPFNLEIEQNAHNRFLMKYNFKD